MTIEQATARLAGGFSRPIDNSSLRASIQAVLPDTPLLELENIRQLPGMVDAATSALNKVWLCGVDLDAETDLHPRLEAISSLEKAILKHLPSGMMRPVDLVSAAISRIEHASAIMGRIDIYGLVDLPPCWKPLLHALTKYTMVTWHVPPGSDPGWLENTGAAIVHATNETPKVSVVNASTTYHEAIETIRWARSLLASGVSPEEIAICATSPNDYDDHFLALHADASIDLHFVHGVKCICSRHGQAAAALAEIMLRGLTQSRLRRLVSLCGDSRYFTDLPTGWLRILPADAALSTSGSLDRLLDKLTAEQWPDNNDHTPKLRAAMELLTQGVEEAVTLGDSFLSGRALAIWRKALASGPAISIDTTLATLKQDDGL